MLPILQGGFGKPIREWRNGLPSYPREAKKKPAQLFLVEQIVGFPCTLCFALNQNLNSWKPKSLHENCLSKILIIWRNWDFKKSYNSKINILMLLINERYFLFNIYNYVCARVRVCVLSCTCHWKLQRIWLYNMHHT